MVELLFGQDNGISKPVYARSGWEIPQVIPPQYSQKQIQIRSQEVLRFRQKLQLATVSNYPYNCVGLVFASRRAWIDPEHHPKLLIEDGYKRIQRVSAIVGDVVVYRDQRDEPVHVGMIITVYEIGESRSINVLSKWGSDGEFIHDERNVVSYLGEPSDYWTLGHEEDI